MSDAAARRVVSFNDEMLILVNAKDDAVGYLDKGSVHDGDGVLHRAFSIFLFNSEGEVLLQQRAQNKRLWPGYWSNSCCSHPRQGEQTSEAAVRRVKQELGVESTPEFLYKFIYQAHFGELGSEHECCSVFIASCDQTVRPNTLEIKAWRWIDPAGLTAEVEANAERFTPWMKQEWHHLTTRYQTTLANFLSR